MCVSLAFGIVTPSFPKWILWTGVVSKWVKPLLATQCFMVGGVSGQGQLSCFWSCFQLMSLRQQPVTPIHKTWKNKNRSKKVTLFQSQWLYVGDLIFVCSGKFLKSGLAFLSLWSRLTFWDHRIYSCVFLLLRLNTLRLMLTQFSCLL